MALRDLKLNVQKGGKPIEPLEVFNTLTLRGSIENIWGPQQEALQDWHKNRSHNDNIVKMNTGGGKTLVGLLIAQSLVNESKHVLYVCANNQLVEQTKSKADDCGINYSARYKSAWENERKFNSAEAFCITNYASVFNGKSIFHQRDVDAVIFDDAHVAENIIRSQFTLSIENDKPLFARTVSLFRSYFSKTSIGSVFEDVVSGAWGRIIFVPMFIINEYAKQLRALFIEGGVDTEVSTLFSWEYLKDNLNHCCFFISGRGIEITPPVIPFHRMSFFNSQTQRIYLTATMPTQTAFVRTFGKEDVNIISPSGKSGDAQRLFVFLRGEEDKQHKDDALKLIGHRKSCIISPSSKKAEEWKDDGYLFKRKDGHSKIQEFVNSENADMLVLCGRYDGIDLPGKACQILVLDRLPMGESLYDSFIDKSIQIDTIRSSQTATRLVQAIGRIFRSNTDHGVVMLRGGDIQRWLLSPKNSKFFPALLQKQIQLSKYLIDEVNENKVSYEDLIGKIIDGDKEWDEFYKAYIEQFEIEETGVSNSQYLNLLIKEREAFQNLWDGQYGGAASDYLSLAKEAYEFDKRLGAWYYHWAAHMSQLSKNEKDSISYYILASNERVELGRPKVNENKVSFRSDIRPKFQAKKLADFYKSKRSKIPRMLDSIGSNLQYGKETNKTEQAIEVLGKLLGLDSFRPDKTSHTGPDVLWIAEEINHLASFELKTDKKQGGFYSKDNIKDCNDHHVWLEDNYEDYTFCEALVGQTLKVVDIANPSEELLVIELEQFNDLYRRISNLYRNIGASGTAELEVIFERWLRHYGLIMPQCVNALKSSKAIDLKNLEED